MTTAYDELEFHLQQLITSEVYLPNEGAGVGLSWRGIAELVIRRAISFFLALLILLTILFVVFRVGIGVEAYVPKGVTQHYLEELRTEFHSNDSIVVQYLYYLGDMLVGKGCFELRSMTTHGQVGDLIRLMFLPTLMLFGLALISSFLAALAYKRFILGMKSGTGRLMGSSIAFFIWTAPFALVVMFLIAELVFRFSIFPALGLLPEGYNDMGAFEKTYEQLRIHALPIVALLISSLGGFALAIRDGTNDHSTGNSTMRSDFVNSNKLSQVLQSVMPILKLNLAWIMSCVFVVEVMFGLGGLGRLAMSSILNWDYALMEASIFSMIVIVLLAGVCLDLPISIACARSNVPSQSIPATPPPVTFPASPAVVVGTAANRLSHEMKWLAKSYVRDRFGMVGLVILLAMGIIALVGPSVAEGPTHSWNPDPVSEFLRGSRDSFLYAFAVTLLSFVAGLAGGLAAIFLGRYNYPIILLAESLLVFPIMAMLILIFIATPFTRSTTWHLIWPTVLIAWAPVTLAVAKHAEAVNLRIAAEGPANQGMARFKRTLAESIRETLPGALSALKFVVVIGTLSILLFGFEFARGGWPGMVERTLQYGYWEEISLWWILPAAGFTLLLAGFYLVIRTAEELARRRFAEPISS